MVLALFFLFGLVIGSFLNVCIVRIPEDESIVSPPSHCPGCNTPIRPYDNIPVLSWLLLRGKCRKCGTRISALYPSVELLTAVVFVVCYEAFGVTIPTFKWLLFSCLIIVLTVTDLRVRMLPDAVTWPGFGLGLAFSWAVPPDDGIAYLLVHNIWKHPLAGWLGVLDALVGAAFGSLLFLGAGAAYRLLRHREGLGLGDVKMMATVGAFLGLRGSFLTILLGTLLGSVVGIGVIAALYLSGWKRGLAERASRRGLGTVSALRWTIASQYHLPLGTFLGVAALLVVFLSPVVELRLLR